MSTVKGYGIDISAYQKGANFSMIKAAGVDFIILRCIVSNATKINKDTCFEDFYKKAKANGIGVGVYLYTTARSKAWMKNEIDKLILSLRGKTFEYPIYIDVEDSLILNTGKNNVSEVVKYGCDLLEQNGFFAGIYASSSVAKTYFTQEIRDKYAMWIAQWTPSSAAPSYNSQYGMWQYAIARNKQFKPVISSGLEPYVAERSKILSDDGKVPGINGECDLDICYVDYPSIMKTKGFNGYYISGDVNGDGEVDDKDATMTLNEYANSLIEGKESFNEKQKAAADVDGDGKVTEKDSTKILKKFAKKMLEDKKEDKK